MSRNPEEVFELSTEADTEALGKELALKWRIGDVILLSGNLGAGKTTFVRALIRSLGWTESVRSPTFNLLQLYPTAPPVLHADLYRVKNAAGIGLEDYLDSHLCFVEWPDRLGELVNPDDCWQIQFEYLGDGRRATLRPPAESY